MTVQKQNNHDGRKYHKKKKCSHLLYCDVALPRSFPRVLTHGCIPGIGTTAVDPLLCWSAVAFLLWVHSDTCCVSSMGGEVPPTLVTVSVPALSSYPGNVRIE